MSIIVVIAIVIAILIILVLMVVIYQPDSTPPPDIKAGPREVGCIARALFRLTRWHGIPVIEAGCGVCRV